MMEFKLYECYEGLIFDMDGTILDTEPTHRQAWRQVLAQYDMQFNLKDVVALNGAPSWRIAQFIIDSNNVRRRVRRKPNNLPGCTLFRKTRCGEFFAF